MAQIHYKCIACGSMRDPGAFGIDANGYDPAAQLPVAQVAIRYLQGYRKISWERHPLSVDDAKALRARYAAAVAQLDAEIAEAEAAT